MELVAGEVQGVDLLSNNVLSLLSALLARLCHAVPCSVQDFLCSNMLEAACNLNMLGDALEG